MKRLLSLLILFISLLPTAAIPAASAQSTRGSAPATVEVHSRFCPPGYDGDDLFGACHENPGNQGIEFSLNSQFATPDALGNLTFTALEPGAFTLSNGLPSELHRAFIYCSESDGMNGAQIPTGASTGSGLGYGVTLNILAGQHLICDWYTIPNGDFLAERANLTIHQRFCPVDYQNSGSAFADCHGNIGFEYGAGSLNGPTLRNTILQAGNLVFSWLQPGDYIVTLDGEVDADVVCSSFAAPGVPLIEAPVSADGGLPITLNPGDDIVCDWYAKPPAEFYQQTTPLPVWVVACQQEQVIGIARGELPAGCFMVPGVTVISYPTYGGEKFADSCTTGSDGTCDISQRFMVPLTVEIAESDLPAGYRPAGGNPQSFGSMYTEFAAIIVVVIPE